MKKLLVVLALCIMTSCAAWKSIQWSSGCNIGVCSICANIDSVKFNSLNEQQLFDVMKLALTTSLIDSLSASYGAPNLGSIAWNVSYVNGKVCLNANVQVHYATIEKKAITLTQSKKSKAVVSGIYKSLHKK
jgi:hypothetical protein